MTSPSLKQIFTYDADGFYADGSIAQRNPQNPDEWLFPQDCTTVDPGNKKGVFFKIKDKNDVNSGWDEIPYPSSAAELVGVQISHASRTAHDNKMRQILQQLVAAEPELYKEVAVNDESGNKIATTVEEIPQPTPEELRKKKEDEVRAKRDSLISKTDYLLAPDYPISAKDLEKVKAYRQALRDVPSQVGFPDNVVWPDEVNYTVIRD
ncbi:tail fiber assembly protein [Parasutterella sp.]|uniref:tail fiber assembly protein n=1 Tax=Parasutterella sp. TaxID=2049037 RepID=UPI003AF69253